MATLHIQAIMNCEEHINTPCTCIERGRTSEFRGKKQVKEKAEEKKETRGKKCKGKMRDHASHLLFSVQE